MEKFNIPGAETVKEPLRLPPREALNEQACTILEAHGCQITYQASYTEVRVPEGTTRQELGPRAFEQHYKLTFPDGWTIEEHRRNTPTSLLYIPPQKP